MQQEIFSIDVRNFYSLEVVSRGSETQLQVGENFNFLIYPFKELTPQAAKVIFQQYVYR